jgi:hypothetical protein
MQHQSCWSTRLIAACIGAAVLCELSCGSSDERITFGNSDSGKTVSVQAGKQFDVALGAVGPAYFVAPPTISSTCVQFLRESDHTGAPTPGGYTTQTFTFEAVNAGQADIVIGRGMAEFAGFSLTVQVY